MMSKEKKVNDNDVDEDLLFTLREKMMRLNNIIAQCSIDEINTKAQLSAIQSFKKTIIREKKELSKKTNGVKNNTFNQFCSEINNYRCQSPETIPEI